MRIAELLHRLRGAVRRTGLLPLRGVRVIARDGAGRVVLVRHRYGDREAWMLPGGGMRSWERPTVAGRRELREEAGCDLGDGCVVARFRAEAYGVLHPLFLVAGTAVGNPVPDGVEVGEAALFDPAALPPAASPATRRHLAEWLSAGPYASDW